MKMGIGVECEQVIRTGKGIEEGQRHPRCRTGISKTPEVQTSGFSKRPCTPCLTCGHPGEGPHGHLLIVLSLTPRCLHSFTPSCTHRIDVHYIWALALNLIKGNIFRLKRLLFPEISHHGLP